MSQTILSVVLEADPASVGRLSKLVEELRAYEDVQLPGQTERYVHLKESVPALHFMSMSVFEGADYDPIFVIEANFDGSPGPFWGQLEAAHGPRLRAMLRCCKRPADQHGPLYDAVTAAQSRYPVAPYLEARTLHPSVCHVGNRGLTRDRILVEGELFLATRTQLAQANPTLPNPYRSMTAEQIHPTLRAALLPQFPWLEARTPARIPPAERIADLGRLVLFVFATLFCLSLPGLVLAPVTPTRRFLVLFAVAAAIATIMLYRMRAPLTGKAAPARSGGLTFSSLSRKNTVLSLANPLGLLFWIALFLAGYLVVASFLGAGVAALITGLRYGAVLLPTVRIVSLGLVSVVFSLLALVVWLRWLERRRLLA